MRHRYSDPVLFVFVAAMLFGAMLAFLAVGGCQAGRGRSIVTASPPSQPAGSPQNATLASDRHPRAENAGAGPIVIRVRIVDTDPSDDVSLSFVWLCARIVDLVRGEP